MKAISLLTSLIIVITILSSCKKSDTGAGSSYKRIQIVTSGGESSTLEYNSNGKVSKVIQGGNSGYDTYIYSGNTVTINYFDNQSQKTGSEVSTLNSQGYISSSTNSKGGNTSFEYDNFGHCIKETYSQNQNTSIKTYTYTDGNMTSSIANDGGSFLQPPMNTILIKKIP